jgi:hypothetical protein
MIASHQRAVWLLALLVCGVTNAALPNAAAAPAPKMVEANGPDRKEFRTSVIKLACASPRRMSIGYFRGLASDEIGATRSIKFAIGERDFSFAPKSSITKTDSIESRGSFDVRFAYEPFEFFLERQRRDE